MVRNFSFLNVGKSCSRNNDDGFVPFFISTASFRRWRRDRSAARFGGVFSLHEQKISRANHAFVRLSKLIKTKERREIQVASFPFYRAREMNFVIGQDVFEARCDISLHFLSLSLFLYPSSFSLFSGLSPRFVVKRRRRGSRDRDNLSHFVSIRSTHR